MVSKYAESGVDVSKRGIGVFKQTINNLFPDAFCVVYQDPNFPEYEISLHTDGAGSKPVQNYLHWKETGQIHSFEGIAQDIIAMNLDDIMCVGSNPTGFVDYVAINKLYVPKEKVLGVINHDIKSILDDLRKYHIDIPFAGGETADLPDQLRTLDVSGTIIGHVKLSNVITGEKIKEDDIIVGLKSGGDATSYENGANSGIMCNGITLARHCLMKNEYEKNILK